MVTCPTCQHQNPDGSRFCNNCGQPLPITCPNCGHQNPAGARFCNWCGFNLVAIGPPPSNSEEGEIIETTAVSPSGSLSTPQQLVESLEIARRNAGSLAERRIVTILFCDVVGSTAAAARLDPEDWTEIINGAFEQMIRPVYDYGGTVPRLMGDGLLAFFGAPQAHEDDPERAILAGLDIIRRVQSYADKIRPRWEIELNVRIGINTGLVTVGEVGSGQRAEYTAMGDAINLAARMEQTAAPGTLQITQATYNRVIGRFKFEPLGEINVKGKEEAQPAYRVLGRAAQADMPPTSTQSPFVGREPELETLHGLLEELENGLGRVVCLIGDAGLGKSRLIEEVCDSRRRGQVLPDVDPKYLWLECYGISYEMNRPYGLFQRLIRDLLQSSEAAIDIAIELGMEIDIDLPMAIGDSMANENVREKIEEAGKQPGSALALLLGLDLDDSGPALEGDALKGALFETVGKLLEGWGSSKPAILLLDDLQWADQASIELIRHLFHLVDRSPLLLICLFRPDRQAPSWSIKLTAETDFNHLYTEIILNPLDNAQSKRLIEALLADDTGLTNHGRLTNLPHELNRTIIAKSEGNPFFIEEVFRGLIEMGVSDGANDSRIWRLDGENEEIIRIPNSVQALLTARIDRLEARSKRTLQIASVIGRRFIYKILQQIHDEMGRLEEQINTLEKAAFIQEVIRIPEREYQFNQALVQEAAYHTLLRKERRYYHRRVAESIEDLFADRLEEFANQLAYHYDEAGDIRAAVYHRLSGDIAYRLHANDEAATHYDRALIIVKAAPTSADDDLIYLYDRRGRAFELAGRYDKALSNYEEMEKLGESRSNPQIILDALVRQGLVRSVVNKLFDPEEAKSLSNRALKLAQKLGDQEAEARILWIILSLGRFGFHDIKQAIKQGERGLTITHQLGSQELHAYILNDLGDLMVYVGKYDKAEEMLQESAAIWRQLGNQPMLTDSLINTAVLYSFTGDYDHSIALFDEAYKISQKINNIWGQSYARTFSGQVYYDFGRFKEAIDIIQEGIRLSDQAGFLVGQVTSRSLLGVIYAELGAIEYGLAMEDEAEKLWQVLAPLLKPIRAGYMAQVHLINRDILAAAALLDDVNEKDHPLGIYAEVVVGLARIDLELAREAPEEALKIAEELLERMRHVGVRAFQAFGAEKKAKALIMLGREEEAVAELEWGRSVAEEIGHRWSLWSTLALLSSLKAEQAETLLAQARQLVLAIAADIPENDPASGLKLRQSFLSRPAVRRVMQKNDG